ncbi:WD40/YVTN/BNR-like repeat-containing protein [Nitratireductor sp. GCM10026969]|uniref:WD40/YVTN/BNR-like repeat-containing protein n=1 Tax=Nitratireductor sp. GCM10026969 TaxID=3252645 RepID=UPI00361F40EB
MAFDGDGLIVAHDTLSRRDGGGALTLLPGPTGGNILSLATHKDRAGRIAAGLKSGGVALSEDGGQSWEAGNRGLPDAPVTAVTMAALSLDTLYAAVHGDGLWKSEDAGRSWIFAMDRPWLEGAERDLTALASVDLATGMGGIWIYAGTEMGLTRVPDCLCRWQDVQPGDAMDTLISGAAPAPEKPLPAGEPILALVSAASLPTRLYAALPSGIWVSEDAGVVWVQRSTPRAEAVAVSPKNADHVAALTEGGLIQSRDGGMTWTALADL